MGMDTIKRICKVGSDGNIKDWQTRILPHREDPGRRFGRIAPGALSWRTCFFMFHVFMFHSL